MPQAIIERLSWAKINDLMLDAKQQIRLILPALHEDWAMLLEKVKENGLSNIKVCINNSEKYIRDGFGDDKSITMLLKSGISIKQTENNRISFLSADNIHFLFFPTSRIFEKLNDENITNAISLDDLTALQITYAFFPDDKPALKEDLSTKISESTKATRSHFGGIMDDIKSSTTEVLSKELSKNEFEIIRNNLKINPPQSPDLRREIEVYTMKVQFVELTFENGKITGRRVKIPPKVMPFQSDELKRILESSMRIFQTDGDTLDFLDGYKSIQKTVKTVRECYLKNIRCRNDKSILEKSKKEAFEKEIASINKSLEETRPSLITDIDNEIELTQERLCKELNAFFLKNPPTEFKEFTDDKLKTKVERYVENIVYHAMPFPKATQMVKKMCLKYKYYDLTWDDLSDDELLKEFEQKKILKDDLDSIRNLKKAFEAKK